MSEMKTRNMDNEIELDEEQFVTFLIGDETYGVDRILTDEELTHLNKDETSK